MFAYVALTRAPRADWDDDGYPSERTMSVLVSDEVPHNTGLVTAEGVPIYRVEQREPVGFCRDRTGNRK